MGRVGDIPVLAKEAVVAHTSLRRRTGSSFFCGLYYIHNLLVFRHGYEWCCFLLIHSSHEVAFSGVAVL